MFYDKDEIDELLKCPDCREIFVEPHMLPCGHHMCDTCIRASTDGQTSSFLCKMCGDGHPVPRDGFPVSKVMLQLLEKKPREVYRSNSVERLKSLLGDIKETRTSLAFKFNRPAEQIREHCDSVRNELQIKLESHLEYVHSLHSQMMRQLELYEQDCSANTSALFDKNRMCAEETCRAVDSFVAEQHDYLQQFAISDEGVANALERADQLKHKLATHLDFFNYVVFKNQVVYLTDNRKETELNILGKLKMRQLCKS